MTTPPSSPLRAESPLPPPEPAHPPPESAPTHADSAPPLEAGPSSTTSKKTRKATRLRSLATRAPGADRPVVHVDPSTGKADGPQAKKLRTYLGIVARDKVDITLPSWKEVPSVQKDLIWEDIQAEFDIPEASDQRTKRKILQTVGERWRQFKSDLTRKWVLAGGNDDDADAVCSKYGISHEQWTQFCQSRRAASWEDVRKKAQAIQKQNTAPHVLSRGGYELLEKRLMEEKQKKQLEAATRDDSTDTIIHPPSPVRRHVKWKLARTKKTGEMTSEAARQIAERIDSLEEQSTQGSFVASGRQDVLTTAIGRPEHPGRVRGAGAGVTITQYFGPAPSSSRKSKSSSMAPEDLDRLKDNIRVELEQSITDRLTQSITERVTQQVMMSFSQLQSHIQSQGAMQPPEVQSCPLGARVSTKGSCVDPSGNDRDTDASDRRGLYVDDNPPRLVALGRVHEGSTTVHGVPLAADHVKVSVEEVRDGDARVPVPTDEIQLVGQALNTFLAWPTHLVHTILTKDKQEPKGPAKPVDKPERVSDPLYHLALTIPDLFLRPFQVPWDPLMFGVHNDNFPLYIKHEDLSEIIHGGQCLNISVIQLWMLHMSHLSLQSDHADVFGFLEPQSIQRSGQSQFQVEDYMKKWMQTSQKKIYLAPYLNGSHWQLVVICPKANVVAWFCSLHNRPDNYLKGIINSALKGVHDSPENKSKATTKWIALKCNKQTGSTECGYYVMHWMQTIVQGSFTDSWDTFFTDQRPLEADRLKAIRVEWAKYFLKVREDVLVVD